METRVESQFADGEYAFWLPLPQIFELERACGSMLAIEERLRSGIGIDDDGQAVFTGGGTGTVQEIRETIRLALIGGNRSMIDGEEAEVGPLEAKRLVDAYCYPARPLVESAALAWRILSTAIYGVQLKKKASEPDGESLNPSPKGS